MSETEQARHPGQRKVGLVVSRPGAKTVKVMVERKVEHTTYRRFIKRTKNFLAHDEKGQCGVGDTVEIVESRPLSARKRWRVRRIVTRAEGGDLPQVPAGE